jgi:hypothetical protein
VYVLTAAELKSDWNANATETITAPLRGPDLEEAELLKQARAAVTPTASSTRITSALGAPVANVALLGAAAVGFAGDKTGVINARSDFFFFAGACALLSVVLSVIGTTALRGTTARLSRLDLLQQELKSVAPPLWVTWACTALFVVALLSFGLSFVWPGKSTAPSASFGPAATSTTGGRTTVSFTVKWAHLGSDAARVSTVVTGIQSGSKTVVSPKKSDGTVDQRIAVIVVAPKTLTVDTQAVGANAQPVGDKVEHTYEISAEK